MVLVDTSVWVAHLRQGTIGLETLLNEGLAACHPFVMGELACGNLKHRSAILVHLQALPQAIQAENDEVIHFIENYSLMGKGLGYIDMHLLASAKLTMIPLWTLDRRLNEVAVQLKLAPF
jgi:predicted nucleic acid-binding protein